MAAASNKRRLLLLLAAAAATSAGQVAGSQGFFRRPAATCVPGAVSRAVVNFSSAVGSHLECAFRCSDIGWCAALLMGLGGCCDCALIDSELYYGAWLGQGADCPDGLFEKVAGALERLQFSSCQQSAGFSPCERAIDGNTTQDFNANSCTHTNTGNTPKWWRANLPQRAFIERVALFNRIGVGSWRLNNFTISLDGVVFASYFESSYFLVKNFSCVRVGQAVQVDLYRNDVDSALTLCEVIAYGRWMP